MVPLGLPENKSEESFHYDKKTLLLLFLTVDETWMRKCNILLLMHCLEDLASECFSARIFQGRLLQGKSLQDLSRQPFP